jgi:oligosaccharide repeat unit polymerase
MIENFNQLFIILFQTILIFIVLFLLYRKRIFSIFDPLFFYLVTQAFSIELGIIQITDLGYLTSFLLSQLFFAVGFNYFSKNIHKDNIIDDSELSFAGTEYKFWAYFTVFGFVVVLIANLYLFYLQGIILFSDDPTVGKVSAFEGGGGIGAVRRINWGLLNLVNLSAVFIYVKTRNKLFLFILIALVLIAVSGGSKSSLIVYVVLLAFLGLFKSINQTKIFRAIDKVKVPFIIAGLALSIFIIGGSTAGLTDSILGLGIRFLYFGDILFYYYNSDAVAHFQQLGILDFFKYEFNSFLGILRITPYLAPLSFEMVQYSFTHNEVLEVVTGPNLPYYVKGHIFFGKYGALIYSFLLGLFIASIRNWMFVRHSSYTKYLFLIFFNFSIFSFAQDSALMISVLFDTFIFSLIPIFLSLLLLYSPIIKKISG